MKRLSCLLVALLLVIVAVFCTSCGEEEELLEFIDAVQAYEVKRVVCDIEIETLGATVLKARTTWTKKAGTITYEVFNELSSDATADMTTTVEKKVENGANVILLGDIDFSADNLSSFEIKDGVLTCVVTDPEEFFGAPLNTDRVIFTVTVIGEIPTGATLSYETDDGLLVSINATFV